MSLNVAFRVFFFHRKQWLRVPKKLDPVVIHAKKCWVVNNTYVWNDVIKETARRYVYTNPFIQPTKPQFLLLFFLPFQCIEIIRKQCRCGQHSKELPCSKSFLCDTKCKQMRDCNKHACSRKCCDNQCPPCDRICGKTLSCGKHKCSSLCHHGPCYPCTAKAPVKCR